MSIGYKVQGKGLEYKIVVDILNVVVSIDETNNSRWNTSTYQWEARSKQGWKRMKILFQVLQFNVEIDMKELIRSVMNEVNALFN